MYSLLFIYLCFNVYKTSNNSHFFRVKHCKYIVGAKQQFQKNFMYLNRLINLSRPQRFPCFSVKIPLVFRNFLCELCRLCLWA